MSEPTPSNEHLPLYESFDEAGKAWLEEVVRTFNEGGYEEALRAHLTHETAILRGDDV